MLIGCGNDFFVTHRATRLDHGSCTGLDRRQKAIGKREERIRRNHRAHGAQCGFTRIFTGFFGFPCRNARAVNAAHLPGTNTNGLAVFDIDNGV